MSAAAACGAAKRSWRPVGQMLLWQLQGIRCMRILSFSSGGASALGSNSSTLTWLYRTVANGFFRPARPLGAKKQRIPFLGSSASQAQFASGSIALKEEEEAEKQPQHKDQDQDQDHDYEKWGQNHDYEDSEWDLDHDSDYEEWAKSVESVNSNFWGVITRNFTKSDGLPWLWNSYRPREPNFPINYQLQWSPTSYNEWIAMWIIRTIKIPVNTFFSTRYGCRAMKLETVAAVPGMVGGMLLHLRSLRHSDHSGGWIKALLDEAENERMHLVTLMELVQPAWYERASLVAVQGVFFNFYFVLYLLSPRLAHRVIGYLKEEVVLSYTTFLKEIDKGVVENVPAPAIEIDYWRLPPEATLRDMVIALRIDEARHRDVNHYAADLQEEGEKLSQSPAPAHFD